MSLRVGVYLVVLVLLLGCSTKKNNLFTRQYHQLTTRYNVYFNGNEALKAGVQKMEQNHREDYTNLLPVFVSNNEQTRSVCNSDMDYAIEKAVKAIDVHSITAKPKRRKNKDSRNYESFRKKKEFNNQIAKCYLLLGKAYFYKKKYAMANNTFRYIQRQYGDNKKLVTEMRLWLFRSLTEMERYDEAAKVMDVVDVGELSRKQRELFSAAQADFYVRQGIYSEAIRYTEQLIRDCKSMKRRPRYYFLLSQLYLKENQEAQASYALRKAMRFNFNYEMVFNAKINMALAYQSGNDGIVRKLKKMLRDVKNIDFQDRIYYALANIEEKQGNEEKAVELYWKSVHSSVDNDNQKSLSFLKLGDYYFQQRDYIPAQSCYDSCLYFMDSRIEGYDHVKVLVTDLTDLVTNLNTIQVQDSLLKLAALPEKDRLKIIDEQIQKVKDEEARIKEEERQAQQERSFYMRNNMISRGDAFSQRSSGGDWYFYNPMTIALGKNDFKRKWGRRKLEDNWRRVNKAVVEVAEGDGESLETEEVQENLDVKSREYYLKDIPLTPDKKVASEKKIEDAYYKAGEIYFYKFDDPLKALACFDAFISRFQESAAMPMVHYQAYMAAEKAGKTDKADFYKDELIRKYPESDFAKGLQNPEYFREVEENLQLVNTLYEKAYNDYQNVYYKEALQQCEDILSKYPDTKLKENVLFLKAMCMVNLYPASEARKALDAVLEVKPHKEIREVVTAVLASLDMGDKPVLYADGDMAMARDLKSNRNWVFDRELSEEDGEKKGSDVYKVDKDQEQEIILLLPESLKKIGVLQIQARLGFINAAEEFDGRKYRAQKDDLWYKMPAIRVGSFKNYEEAVVYLNKVATDKVLLKNLSGKEYRFFTIGKENMSALKRLKDVEAYVDFFVRNYFEDTRNGELITGRLGTAAHMFSQAEEEKHDFVLALPFREINVKKIAELLHSLETAYLMEKEDYDDNYELLVVKGIGNKAQAMEYMNMVLKNSELYNRLSLIPHENFIITQSNLKVLISNHYLEEYMTFFKDNYVRSSGEIGVEDGDFVYNKDISHKFALLYSNKIDPYKLKMSFEEINFAGLTVHNQKYSDDHDCLTVSGFKDREEAMRYFNMVINNRRLFRPLRSTDYRNFIISDANFEVLKEKKNVEAYLLFFRRYYID